MRVEGNRVAVGGHEFRVLPEGAPEGQKLDHDTKDVTLPEGWAIVSRADPRFDVVKEKLIAAHGWSAYAVAVRRDAESAQGAKIFSTLWTKNAPAGQKAGSFVDDDASYAHSLGGGKFSMKEASARYLLHREAPPKPESSPAAVPPLSMSDEVRVDGNKVVAGAWEFRVAPEAAPGGSFIAHDKLPFDMPAGLVALAVGVVIAMILGESRISADGLGFYPPMPYFGDLVAGIQHLWANPELFLVLIPVQIYNFIETMNNVESAEAAGDEYPVAICQVTDGAGTMIGALFGSPFPTTAYIGHPAYKRMGAHAGYIIGVGVVIPLAAIFGLLAFLGDLMPVAAAAPVLVFVALSLVANTAQSVRPEHMAAVGFAMLPHVSDFLIVKWGSLIGALGATGVEGLPSLGDPALTAALLQQGAHYSGHLALSQGAILTGLIWGAIVASLIDGRFKVAAGFTLAGAAMSSVGIIHGASLRLPSLEGLTGGYLIAGAFFLIYPMVLGDRAGERGDPVVDEAAPDPSRAPAE